MNSVKRKVAIVTGSSRGIGKSIARSLLSGGATVYVTGREQKTLQETFSEFHQEYGDSVASFQGDLTKTDTIRHLLDTVVSTQNRLDIVVANIGSGRYQTGWDIPDEVWSDSIETNMMAAIRIVRESIRIMEKQQSGVILVIGTIAGVERISAPVPYAIAKAALLQYVNYTAESVARLGIRINAISPGNIFIEGGTWDKKRRADPEGVNSYIQAQVPVKRFGSPMEIAELASFLVSDQASFITGSNFVIDGGQSRVI